MFGVCVIATKMHLKIQKLKNYHASFWLTQFITYLVQLNSELLLFEPYRGCWRLTYLRECPNEKSKIYS